MHQGYAKFCSQLSVALLKWQGWRVVLQTLISFLTWNTVRNKLRQEGAVQGNPSVKSHSSLAWSTSFSICNLRSVWERGRDLVLVAAAHSSSPIPGTQGRERRPGAPWCWRQCHGVAWARGSGLLGPVLTGPDEWAHCGGRGGLQVKSQILFPWS